MRPTLAKAWLFLIAAFVFVLDQATKRLAVEHLRLDASDLVLIPRVLYLTRTSNTGSAFGLFPGSTVVLAVASLAAAVAIAVYVARYRGQLPALLGVALALPLGGAVGNFADRARLGYVIDFIGLQLGSYQWPIFNIADSAICIGVALLVIVYLRGPSAARASRRAGRGTIRGLQQVG